MSELSLSLALVLLVAHFVGDFICQSDWMAINKSKRLDALILHVLVYSMVVGVCLIFVGDISDDERRFFVSVNAAAHLVQDAITSRINSRLWFIDGVRMKAGMGAVGGSSVAALAGCYEVAYNDKRHWFFVGIGADQLLHYVTLFVTASWWL